jgi:hypothetical protein
LDKYYIGVLEAVAHSITDSLAAQLQAVLVVAVEPACLMVCHVDHQAVIHQAA